MEKNILDFYLKNKKIIDVKNTYYFDESGNIRVGRLGTKDNNKNLEKMFFILGGIYSNKQLKLNKTNLLKYCDIPLTIENLKLKTISRGKGFLEIMSSSKISRFFEYLNINGIGIHYYVLHIYSWTLSDIITSFLDIKTKSDAANAMAIYLYYHDLQSDFIEVLYYDFDNFHKLLVKYNFPAIPKEQINDFLEDILELYTYNFDTYFDQNGSNSFTKEMLRQIIKSNLAREELAFLSNQPFVIIDSFLPFYLSRASEIKAKKVFDIEDKIIEELKSTKIDYKKTFNMEFTRSKSSFALQCSDVVVGTIRKFFSFLIENDEFEIIKKFENLSIKQKQSLKAINKLINESNQKSKYLIGYFVPLFIRKREQLVFNLIDSFQ